MERIVVIATSHVLLTPRPGRAQLAVADALIFKK